MARVGQSGVANVLVTFDNGTPEMRKLAAIVTEVTGNEIRVSCFPQGGGVLPMSIPAVDFTPNRPPTSGRK